MRKLITAEAVVTGAGHRGTAVLVDRGKILAVGQREDLEQPGLEHVAHRDGFLYPGFRDAHLHAVPYASLLAGCSLKRATSIDDLVARLESHAERLPPGKPVVATRMDDEHLAERRLPTRWDLDRAVPDRPAVIYRYCGHVAVANSEALAASGINSTTPDPEGGTIDRDASGHPNGILRETAAGMIAPALARGSDLDPATLIAGLERLASLGITSVGAMMGYGEQPSEKLEAEVEVWRAAAPDLPINVAGITITDDPALLRHAADRLTGASPRLRWLGVKRFADGSLGGHTAAMSAPFADVETAGTYRLTEADAAVAKNALELDGMVCIHAIGDGAVEGVLDLFSELIATGADPKRLRMEHASVIRPDQVRRFADLGATACVQPAFLASEADWVADRVGPERAPWLYPFRSMLEAGIPLAGSSDCPVEPPHPLWGMAAAVDRCGISPSEALTAHQAVDMFTTGAAAAIDEPTPLDTGTSADLVVLDRDVSEATPEEIRNATVLATYVAGEPVAWDPSPPAWID
ncbi:MAG: amidohydrolase [Acidimicrobiia bacterium]|nr:amidohydrolase [Acidimicrobiia bacterium]